MANNEWEELLDEEYERLEGVEDEGAFDEEVCEAQTPAGRHPAGPSSNPAEYFAQEHEEAPASAAERLAKLVDTMPGQTKMLTRILDFCRERRTTQEVLDAVAAWQKLNFSVYEPAVLCGLLEKAGGLDHVNEDGTPYVQPDEGTASSATLEDAQDATDEKQADQAEGVLTQEPSLEGEAGTDEVSEEDFDDSCAEPEPQRPSFWVSTQAGLDLVAEHDPRAHVAQMLEDEACYMPVYRELLEKLADGPMTKKEIDVIVRANPASESPRRLGGYFVDRLERIEAIEWTGAWSITEIGRELLDNEALYQ